MSSAQPIPRRDLKNAGLRYSSDEQPGYARRRCGRGFVYLNTRGGQLYGVRVLRRIEKLSIPPAWSDVWICRHASGHLQATGRDDRGRKQYLYHQKWITLRDETKFNQLLGFSEVLPSIRATANRDLRRPQLSKRNVLALCVKLLDRTWIRIGNSEYAEENQSYGLTTLRNQHLKQDGPECLLKFRGKSSKMQEVEVPGRTLAKRIAQCQELPGQELFQYEDTDGNAVPVNSDHVNQYLQSISGRPITAKVFRTWGATVCAADLLSREKNPRNKKEQDQQIHKAAQEVADQLGNTSAVARKSYIHPAVIDQYRQETLQAFFKKRTRSTIPGLRAEEQALAEFLRKETS